MYTLNLISIINILDIAKMTEMLIRTLYFFLNKSNHIIMDCC